jgi:hypothetical protein
MDCRRSNAMEITQPVSNIVIVTNLPDGAIAQSGDKEVTYTKTEDVGAVRCKLPCGWKLVVQGNVVAKSLDRSCILPTTVGRNCTMCLPTV